MFVKINNHILTVRLSNNSSSQALMDLLKDGPLTITMDDYDNMEKIGTLGYHLQRNDKQMTTQPGDVILYQGHYISIYHRPNSWNFTKIGEMQGLSETELRKALGKGEMEVTLSLTED